MVTEKHKKQKNRISKEHSIYRSYLRSLQPKALVVAVVTIVLLLGLVIILPGHSRYSKDPQEVQKRINATQEAVSISGIQLASDVVDKGCDSRTSVGLAKRINCDMEGYKYSRVTGDKEKILGSIDSKLGFLGFKRIAGNEREARVIEGVEEGDVIYTKDILTIRLGWSSFPLTKGSPRSSVLSDAISSHRIDAPSNGVVVGISSAETYWLCTAGNLDILGLGCAFPPKVIQ